MTEIEKNPAALAAIATAIRTAQEDSLDETAQAAAVLDAITALGYLSVVEAIAVVGSVLIHDRDEVHESLCSCDKYPASCVTYPDLNAVLPDKVDLEDVVDALLACAPTT